MLTVFVFSSRSNINLSLEELSISNISRILYELNKTLGLVDYKGVPNMLSFNFLSQLSKILSTCSTCRAHSSSKAATLVESSCACNYLKALIGPAKFNTFCQIFKIICNDSVSNELCLKKESHGISSAMFSMFRSYFCSCILSRQSFMCKVGDLLNMRIADPSAEKTIGAVDLETTCQNSSSSLSAAIIETQIEGTVPSVDPVVGLGVARSVTESRLKQQETGGSSVDERTLATDKFEVPSASVTTSTTNTEDGKLKIQIGNHVITSERIPNQGSASVDSILPSIVDEADKRPTTVAESLVSETSSKAEDEQNVVVATSTETHSKVMLTEYFNILLK